jgi:hypothetical protein
MAKIMKKAQTGKNVPKGMVESEMFPGKMIPKSKSNYENSNYDKMLSGKSSAPKPKGLNFDKKSFDKLPMLKSKVIKKPKAQLGSLVKAIVKSGVKKAEKAAVKTVGQQQAKKALTKAIEKRTMPTSKPSFFDEFDMPESKSKGSVMARKLEANNKVRKYKSGGMLKRADGSYSKRGLWDNIRANKGSGKKPTAAMLKQEKKIKAKTKK